MSILRAVFLAALIFSGCFFSLAQSPKPNIVLHVSPHGLDRNSGDKAHPLRTLEGARDRARAIRNGRSGLSIEVVITSGTYAFVRSFALGKRDGGDSLSKVTYRAERPGTVRLSGGRPIKQFTKITDPLFLKGLDSACAGNVVECDLKKNGITDFGSLHARGFGRPIVPSPLELFVCDRPMTLAAWPNQRWALIADTIAGARDSAFVYSGDRPSRWLHASDVWMHGYWTWDWADSYTRIDNIDTARKLITTTAPHGVYGYTPGKRFRALNVLQELDSPGEYYVDRRKGMLYLWPPQGFDPDSVTVSILEAPLLVLDSTSSVTFAGFTIECTRGAGVEIRGGDHNTIAGCTIRNIGSVGVSVGAFEPELGGKIYANTLYNGNAGHDNGVQSCTISQCGEGGVMLCGGDRATLTPGRNFVDNCLITDCCVWSRTYRAGVYMWGVGNRVSHNVFHDLPHTAVFFWGNDHLLEYNEVHDVCLETFDAGAFYQGRDWSQRGNRIQYNYFHDLPIIKDQEAFTDMMSIYMDDFASGTEVVGNVFVDGARAVMIGGGRDILVENNLFIDCAPSLHIDARGRGWAASMLEGPGNIMVERLRAVHHNEPPYSTHYPRLATILNEHYAIPEGVVIRRNISYGGTWRAFLDDVTDSLITFRDNIVDADPGFVSVTQKDYRLRPDAPAFQKGFKRLPVGRIGLYVDEYRRSALPVPGSIPGGVTGED